MLVFDHVSAAYGRTPVLQELSFSIADGEQVGLIGANGAGKSTLMKAALGLIPLFRKHYGRWSARHAGKSPGGAPRAGLCPAGRG